MLYTAVPVLCRIRICATGIYYLAELKYCTAACLLHGAWLTIDPQPLPYIPPQTANLGLGTNYNSTSIDKVRTQKMLESLCRQSQVLIGHLFETEEYAKAGPAGSNSAASSSPTCA